MAAEVSISLRGVTRVVNGVEILRGVDLDVARGSLTLVLGPNGAGKSTLIRCVAGVIRCGGEIIVEGIDVVRRPMDAKRIIGYSPQHAMFPRGLRVRELVRLHAKLHGLDIDEGELLRFFGLLSDSNKRVEELSGGKRQRLSLALAFAHNPHVLLLDEPFNNLDRDGREMLLDLLRKLRGGKTVLLVTHPIEGVEEIADARAYIDEGVVKWVRR